MMISIIDIALIFILIGFLLEIMVIVLSKREQEQEKGEVS